MEEELKWGNCCCSVSQWRIYYVKFVGHNILVMGLWKPGESWEFGTFFQYVIIRFWSSFFFFFFYFFSLVQTVWIFFAKGKLSCLQPLNELTFTLVSELDGLFAVTCFYVHHPFFAQGSKIVSWEFITIWYLKQKLRYLSKYIVSYLQVYENLLSVELWHCWKALLLVYCLFLPVAVSLPLYVDVCSLLPSLGYKQACWTFVVVL